MWVPTGDPHLHMTHSQATGRRAKEGGGPSEGIFNHPLYKRSVRKDPPSPRDAEDNNRIQTYGKHKVNTHAAKGQSSESH